jgi:hypothetical protein
MKLPSQKELTAIGNTAVVIAIGATATASVAPIVATIVALSSAAVATGALYVKLSAPPDEKKNTSISPSA